MATKKAAAAAAALPDPTYAVFYEPATGKIIAEMHGSRQNIQLNIDTFPERGCLWDVNAEGRNFYVPDGELTPRPDNGLVLKSGDQVIELPAVTNPPEYGTPVEIPLNGEWVTLSGLQEGWNVIYPGLEEFVNDVPNGSVEWLSDSPGDGIVEVRCFPHKDLRLKFVMV